MPTRKKVTVSPAEKMKIVRNIFDAVEETNITQDELLGLYSTSKDGVTFTVQADTTINQDFKGKQFLFYNEGQLKRLINHHIQQAMSVNKEGTITLTPEVVKEIKPEVIEDTEIVSKEDIIKHDIKNPRYVNMKPNSSSK